MIFPRKSISKKRLERTQFDPDRRLGFEPLERRILFANDIAPNLAQFTPEDAPELSAIIGSLPSSSPDSKDEVGNTREVSILPEDLLVIAIRMPNLESIMSESEAVQILVVYPEGYFSAYLPNSESTALESLDLGSQSDLVAMRSDSPEHLRLMELVARASLEAVFVVTPVSTSSDPSGRTSTPTYEIRIEPSSQFNHAPWQGVVSHTFVVDRDSQGNFYSTTQDRKNLDETPSNTNSPIATEGAVDLPTIEVVIEQLRELENDSTVLVSTIELTASTQEDLEPKLAEATVDEKTVDNEASSNRSLTQVKLPPTGAVEVVAIDRYQRESRRDSKLVTSKLQPVDFFLLSTTKVDQVLEDGLDDVVQRFEEATHIDAALMSMDFLEHSLIDNFDAASRDPKAEFQDRPKSSEAFNVEEHGSGVALRPTALADVESNVEFDAWLVLARAFSESPLANIAVVCMTTASRRPLELSISSGHPAWELVEKPSRNRD